MNKIVTALTFALVLGLGTIAKADVSDGPYLRCAHSASAQSRNPNVCIDATNYYNKVAESDVSENDWCHAMFASSNTLFVASLMVNQHYGLSTAYATLTHIIDKCGEPWAEKGMMMLPLMEKALRDS